MEIKLLGYIILFYVGFYFYRLAEDYKKNKWLYGLVGIVSFLAGQFFYLFYIKYKNEDLLDEFSLPFLPLKSFLIGFATVFVIFNLLSFFLSRKNKEKNEIEDIGRKTNQ